MAKFYELFYAAFTKWVEMIGQKASAKIEHSPRRERAAESLFGEFARLSSSSGEVANCFAQVNVLWKLIDWPDFRGFQLFADELIAQTRISRMLRGFGDGRENIWLEFRQKYGAFFTESELHAVYRHQYCS